MEHKFVSMEKRIVFGNVVDIVRKRIFPGKVAIQGGFIESIEEVDGEFEYFLIPGFVDAHLHVESSMTTPLAFSIEAVKHGTIAAMADPHEIANVLGEEGVYFMLDSAAQTPFKFLFGVPSCVPATSFETSGAKLDSKVVEKLLDLDAVGFLAEVMNYPGVLAGDDEVKRKISAALSKSYPVDGHAPGLRGEALKSYAAANITTDHECFEIGEAREKIASGMKILIREGSGAKNFRALIPLLKEAPESIMFCTDDSHPDDLIKGHINVLVKRALEEGYDLYSVLRAASYNPVKHYKIDFGLLQEGDPADFLIVRNLDSLDILETLINGQTVFNGIDSNIPYLPGAIPNKFISHLCTDKDFEVDALSDSIRVIEAIDGELITRNKIYPVKKENGRAISDPVRDILKLVVVNRYIRSEPAVAFIKGFDLKKGAMATSVAHDSHNIIAVGTNDTDLVNAVNWVIKNRGGMVVCSDNSYTGLPLPVAGIMSGKPVVETARLYEEVTNTAKDFGTNLKAPFMTLSFMALLVIPDLKLSDKGLFDGVTFSFTSLFT